MKYSTASIAWEGGSAEIGDQVDESTMTNYVRETWIETGVLVDEAPGGGE